MLSSVRIRAFIWLTDDGTLTTTRPESPSLANGGFAYASRISEWQARSAVLCGSGAHEVIAALAALPPGSRIGVLTQGSPDVNGGRVAAALVLYGVCCLNSIRIPPTQVAVIPDALDDRQGYLECRVSSSELRRLMDAWRLRAVAAGQSPGNLTSVEQALVRRARRHDDTRNVSASAENLHLFFPAYRLTDSDTLITVASRDHLRTDDSLPAVTFVDIQNVGGLNDWGIEPDWVIVNLGTVGRVVAADEITRLHERFPNARHLCVIPGLGHHLIDRLRGRGYKLCWLRETDESADPASRSHQVRCEEVRLDGDKDDLGQLLMLATEARRRAIAADDSTVWAAFNTLRAAIHVLTSLPVERRYYDDAAVTRLTVPTTDELLEALGRFETALSVTQPEFAADLDEARSILAHTAGAADTECHRKRKLIACVDDAVQTNTPLCIVTRNRTVRSAVETCLSEAFQASLSDLNAIGIQIEARRDLRLARISADASLLWTSYAGFQDLDVILSSACRPVTVLLNELERELFAHDIRTWLNRGEAVQRGTEALGVSLSGRQRLMADVADFSQRVLPASKAAGAGSDAALEIASLFEETATAWTTKGPLREARTGVLRWAREVAFENGGVAYFPEEATVTVFRPGAEEPVDLSVGEIRPGDRVVFVERSIGRTIYELMQDALGQSPLVGAAAQMVRLWHRAISAASRTTKLSPQAIHRELRSRGSSITTVQTVRLWLRGAVLGPRDIDDVDRLAAVLNIGQKERSTIESIKTSIRSLRNVYRQFAKIVYRTILVGGTGRRLSQTEYALIEEHGISLADLRDAITTETVLNVARESELRSADQLGRNAE